MNINPAIRELKIALITGEPNYILDWFNDLWNKLTVVETDIYHDNGGGEFIYYLKDGYDIKWIFYYDKPNNLLYCEWCNFWSILRDKFNLEYIEPTGLDEVLIVTQLLLENALGVSSIRIHRNEDAIFITIEYALRSVTRKSPDRTYVLNKKY